MSTTGYADPAGEAPWAMQLVARVEKSSPPTRTAVLEAAGLAVVRLLACDAASDPDWKPAIDRWMAGRIRKHVRRARGARWDNVQALLGVTVAHAGAEVRAFVPTSVESIYPDVAKLQLSGRDLDDADVRAAVEPSPGMLAVAMSAEPALSWTKAAAAVGHACQVARMRMPAEALAAWAGNAFAVQVEHPDVDRWRRLAEDSPVAISDAGFTFPPQRRCEPGVCDSAVAAARWS